MNKWERFGWIILGILTILVWAGVVFAAPVASEEYVIESAIVQTDIKQIFGEINKKANKYQDWQELFLGWSEQEVINFFETWQMTSLDFDDATKRGVMIWGPGYEANPIYRELFKQGVDPGQISISLGVGRYFCLRLLKDIIPDPEARSVIATLLMGYLFFVHAEAVGTHYPYGYRPAGPLPTYTILRIRF